MKPFLSIKEASEYLGLEYKTVYRLVRAGEIPAARLGGVYRIKLTDLEDYFEQQKQRVVSRSGEKSGALSVSLPHCGRCLRAVRDTMQFAGKCESPECAERLCESCWKDDGARHCARHEPSRAEWIRRAVDEHSKGLIPKPITAEQARQAELNYLSRFDRKVRAQTAVHAPGITKPIRVNDWDTRQRTRDHMEQIRQWANQFELADFDLEQMPRNTSSLYVITEATGKQPGLYLAAHCFAHLDTLLRRGVDFAPVELAELLELLQTCVQHAEKANVHLVCAHAAPTGWSAEAIAYINGTERGKIFSHRLVMPILIDLGANKMYRDELDERLENFTDLFSPHLRQEQVEAARAYTERMLLTEQRSLKAGDIAHALDCREDIVTEAFTRLGKDERFTIVEMPGIGPVAALRA